jgi:hypothetical protein
MLSPTIWDTQWNQWFGFFIGMQRIPRSNGMLVLVLAVNNDRSREDPRRPRPPRLQGNPRHSHLQIYIPCSRHAIKHQIWCWFVSFLSTFRSHRPQLRRHTKTELPIKDNCSSTEPHTRESAGNTPLFRSRGGGRGWLWYFLMKKKSFLVAQKFEYLYGQLC